MRRSLPILGLVLSALVAAACAATPPPAPTATLPAPTATPPAPTAAASTNAPAAPTRTFVNGTVQSIDGTKLTLSDGTSYPITSTTSVTRLVPVTITDLKVGQYVAVTAKRQPDNSLLASVVNVFPTTGNTFQRPMTGGDIMTNATINQITGNTFTVTFTGGGAMVALGPNAKINEFQTAAISDVKVGAAATVIASNGAAVGIQIH